MTDVTIKNGTGVKFTFQDGDVASVGSKILASPDEMMMPGSPPADMIIFDLGGCKKTISISGTITIAATSRTDSGADVITILAQKQWLEALADGAQSTVLFTSNYESQTYGSAGYVATKVVVLSVNFTENTGNPAELPFTMELKVGTG